MSVFRILIIILSFVNLIRGQNNIPAYNHLTEQADSLYKVQQYKKAATLYAEAFSSFGGKGYIGDRYQAAACWSLAGYPDSAFYDLDKIALNLKEYDIVDNKDFEVLHPDTRWQVILSKIASEKELIVKNAIACNNLTAENEKLYSAIKKYKCICIGEMHGTEEPSEFLVGLVKTLISHHKKVIVGFEANESVLTEFIQQKNSEGLSKTKFASKEFGDGRNSQAWFKAIEVCNELKAGFCFFDAFTDSLMAKNLTTCYEVDTNSVIVTIGGNVHNMLGLYKHQKTMAGYLKDYFGTKLFTIGHLYSAGTMYNFTREGLKVHHTIGVTGIFSSAVNAQNYFMVNVFENYMTNYSGILYTKIVTASLPNNIKR